MTRHGAAALAAVQTEDSRFQDCGSGVQCECLFSFLSLWESRLESFHILDNLVQRLICQKSIYRNKSAVITHCEVQITIENSLSNSEVVLEVRFSPKLLYVVDLSLLFISVNDFFYVLSWKNLPLVSTLTHLIK